MQSLHYCLWRENCIGSGLNQRIHDLTAVCEKIRIQAEPMELVLLFLMAETRRTEQSFAVSYPLFSVCSGCV